MLSAYFEQPGRIGAIHNSAAGTQIEHFSEVLFERGYATITARRHIRAAEHIVRWANRHDLSTEDLDERVLERFGRHLHRCRCRRFSSANRTEVLAGARCFLRYLQDIAKPAIRESKAAPEESELLKSFDAWMREQRGTSDRTLYNYGLPLRALIRKFEEDLGRLDARLLRRFVLDQSQGAGWAVVKRCTTALRMFLRFLITEERCRPGLLGAVPAVAHWRLSVLPRYLPRDDGERLIACNDSSSAMDKRDRAILLLCRVRAGRHPVCRCNDDAPVTRDIGPI